MNRFLKLIQAVVRVQFPDHWVLQGLFQPHEPCE